MARTKHVFPTAMIAHIWAQQNQDEAHNGCKNHSFSGTALYSYSTPIANFVTNKKGKKAVLITTERYSVTTSGSHMPSASDIPPGIPVFRVTHIGITGGRAPYQKSGEDYHAANLRCMAEDYKEGIEKYSRSKNPVASDYGTSEIERAKEYCKFFGLRFTPSKFPPVTDAMLKKLRDGFKQEAAKKALETKKRKAREALACETDLQNYISGKSKEDSLGWHWERLASNDQKRRKIEFETRQYFAGVAGFNFLPDGWEVFADDIQKITEAERLLQDYTKGENDSLGWKWRAYANTEQQTRYDALEAIREEIAGRETREGIDAYLKGEKSELPPAYKRFATEEQEKALQTVFIERWRNNEDSRLQCYIDATLMRVKGENIQTSRGAEFPLHHGVKAFHVIRHVKESGQRWEKNGKQVHLGHFQIDVIEPDGTVKAGCHTVPYAEIEYVAKQLNLI